MTDEKPKVYTPEEVEARVAESGLEGWYFDADGGWLRRKYATDGWQATLMLTLRWWIGTTIAVRGLRFGCWATATTRKMRCRRPSSARIGH